MMDSVISQLQAAGLVIDGRPETGRLVRCKAEGDRGGKESGWYVLHDFRLDNGEVVQVGRYGNWKTMGKSLLWELVVKEIYGEYSVTVGQAQLESRFTGWQSKRCFALCEEVVARNEKAHYKGMLKHLITGSTLMIEEKNLPVREESNHMNSVFLSNSMQPLELDLGDRRYMVLKVLAHAILGIPPCSRNGLVECWLLLVQTAQLACVPCRQNIFFWMK